MLFVEDDPSVRYVVGHILTRQGHHTLLAATANEASALLLDIPMTPDAAVLDVLLLGMNGVEFGRLLKRLFPMDRLIFMTGWPNIALLDQRPRDSFVLEKPFNTADLLTAIDASVSDWAL